MSLYILYLQILVADLARRASERQVRIIRKGRKQSVRLPKGFRFEGDAVEIRRVGDAVILEPLGLRGLGMLDPRLRPLPVSPADRLWEIHPDDAADFEDDDELADFN